MCSSGGKYRTRYMRSSARHTLRVVVHRINLIWRRRIQLLCQTVSATLNPHARPTKPVSARDHCIETTELRRLNQIEPNRQTNHPRCCFTARSSDRVASKSVDCRRRHRPKFFQCVKLLTETPREGETQVCVVHCFDLSSPISQTYVN